MDKYTVLMLVAILLPAILVATGAALLAQGTDEYRIPVTENGRYVEGTHLIHVRGLIDYQVYIPGSTGPTFAVTGTANVSGNKVTAGGSLYNPRSRALAVQYRSSLVYISATRYDALSLAMLFYIIGGIVGLAGAGILLYKANPEKGVYAWMALIPLLLGVTSILLAVMLAKMTGITAPVMGGGQSPVR